MSKRPLKIHVITDLEGAAMVFGFHQTRGVDGSPANAEAKRILTGEVNACIDGILDEDPKAEVLVWDGHGSGGIVYEQFHDKAQLLPHRSTPAPYGLDETFDAVFFVGQHAMAGTPNAPLAHTYSSKTIEHYKLNGEPVGEFGMRTYMAGTLFGVPVAFLSGDDKAVAEAQALVPQLVGVATKVGTGLESAVSLGPGKARKLIRKGAAKAVRRVRKGKVAPVVLEGPYEWEVRVLEGQSVEGYLKRAGAERVDERTVVIRSEDPRQVMR
ncbi:MAG TPA: M55 family metallopeptidase [Chloroflexota bacterium]|jgi:D-amino peptidase|nr:M55 family metallopeptidase [Chloroflexota bacterium]